MIKVLLVLAYAQMLIQQMDNKAHLLESITSDELASQAGDANTKGLADWFSCMWTSAKACGSGSPSSANQRRQHGEWLVSLSSLGPAWLARWRSPIVQRLVQSMLVQLLYLGSLLFFRSD